jgi:hypothetical protein
MQVVIEFSNTVHVVSAIYNVLSKTGGSSKSRDSNKFRRNDSNGHESNNCRNANNSKYRSSEAIGLSATAETCNRDPTFPGTPTTHRC